MHYCAILQSGKTPFPFGFRIVFNIKLCRLRCNLPMCLLERIGHELCVIILKCRVQESRKKACAVLDKIMSFRRVSNDESRSGSRFSSSSSLSSSSPDDMLGLMMRLEDEIHDNILTILHAAYDSSASVLCWIIKVLTEHPNLLASIKVNFSRFVCVIT